MTKFAMWIIMALVTKNSYFREYLENEQYEHGLRNTQNLSFSYITVSQICKIKLLGIQIRTKARNRI